MSRIELRDGQGAQCALVDLRTGYVDWYHAPGFHDRHGGATYYRSRSDRSHAGWVPARPWLVQPVMVRVDAGTCCPGHVPYPSGLSYGTYSVYVPYDYRGDSPSDYGWPAMVIITPDGVIMANRWPTTLPSAGEFREVALDYVVPDHVSGTTRPEQLVIPVSGTGHNVKRVLSTLYQDRMAYSAIPTDLGCFWTGLSLFAPPERFDQAYLWRMQHGVLRETVRRFPQDGETEEQWLRSIAPPWATVLSAYAYAVQHGDGSMTLAVRAGMLQGVTAYDPLAASLLWGSRQSIDEAVAAAQAALRPMEVAV